MLRHGWQSLWHRNGSRQSWVIWVTTTATCTRSGTLVIRRTRVPQRAWICHQQTDRNQTQLRFQMLNSVTIRSHRTKPILMMDIQFTYNRKEAYTSSAWTSAIDISVLYEMQWCASNHPVCLSEKPGYPWFTFVCKVYWRVCRRLGSCATFDIVNHQGILYKLCYLGNFRFCVVHIDTVYIKLITARFVDSCQSNPVNVVSELPQGSVLGPLLFFLYTSELFSILEKKLISYSNESNLLSVVPSSGFSYNSWVPEL